ncbi:MAG: flagellar hook-basal body complex protein FliE [Planctomycetota bacterium]
MIVNPGISLTPASIGSAPATQAIPSQGGSFGDFVSSAIHDVHASQVNADATVQQFITGRTGDVHEVMLAMEQARMTLTLAVEVRNKVIEAYQEISRMPV